jgi:chaperonin cofactor prefoldin
MGYRDGKPGTEEDIRERIEKLEADCRSYARSVQTLNKRISELEHKEVPYQQP